MFKQSEKCVLQIGTSALAYNEHICTLCSMQSDYKSLGEECPCLFLMIISLQFTG